VRILRILLGAAVVLGPPAVIACTPAEHQTGIRLMGERRNYRITVEPSPPHAMEPARFRVHVVDRDTGQPLQEGEGRIFATNVDGAGANDGLGKGEEVGTFYGRLFFVVPGDWAMALQFRRDSTERLERVDWMQTVLSERDLGQ
jgi:hypothetical protein